MKSNLGFPSGLARERLRLGRVRSVREIPLVFTTLTLVRVPKLRALLVLSGQTTTLVVVFYEISWRVTSPTDSTFRLLVAVSTDIAHITRHPR